MRPDSQCTLSYGWWRSGRKNCKTLTLEASIFLAFLFQDCRSAFTGCRGIQGNSRTCSCDAPPPLPTETLDGPVAMDELEPINTGPLKRTARPTVPRDVPYLRHGTVRLRDKRRMVSYSPALSCEPRRLDAKFSRDYLTFRMSFPSYAPSCSASSPAFSRAADEPSLTLLATTGL